MCDRVGQSSRHSLPKRNGFVHACRFHRDRFFVLASSDYVAIPHLWHQANDEKFR
jgi:hypothetical protein